MSAHQMPLFELGFSRSARLLQFLAIAVDSFYYGQLRTLVMLRPQVRQPGPAVWTHGGVEGVLLFANAYLFISLVHNGKVHD